VLRLADIVAVDPMDEGNACSLLRKKLGGSTECEPEKLRGLGKRLDYMPLAFAQAASYTRDRSRRKGKLLQRGSGEARQNKKSFGSKPYKSWTMLVCQHRKASLTLKNCQRAEAQQGEE
jgi:hypothetical protein